MSFKNEAERIKIIEDAFLAIYDVMEKQEGDVTIDYSLAISNLEEALKSNGITPAQETFFKRVLNQWTKASTAIKKKADKYTKIEGTLPNEPPAVK